MTRHEAREQAFLVLFDKSFHPDQTLEEVISVAAEDEMITLDKFANSVVSFACENEEKIDTIIEQNLRGWKMSRISRVSLSVLRLAVAELLIGEAPEGVIANEAVELCKLYSGKEDASFVNGVLGEYIRGRKSE
ncbi:MAG: transcription antitermination factor NusB [Clostridia bacterium]|nr:transcription antitermination factor NusB [Clostridia bacterium]